MKSILALILILPTMAYAHGSHGVGNGGNAIVCYTDASKTQITSVQMFDYWEKAQEYPGLSVDLGDDNDSVINKINLFVQRMKAMNLGNSAEIDQFADDAALIVNNIDYYLTNTIPTVDDDLSTLTPQAPCYKEQFAVQFQDASPTEKRFVINSTIYNSPQTNNTTRAGIIMHEVFYREAIALFNDDTSERARLMNFAFASNFYPTLLKNNPSLLAQILNQIGFGFNPIRVFLIGKANVPIVYAGPSKIQKDLPATVTLLKDFDYQDDSLMISAKAGAQFEEELELPNLTDPNFSKLEFQVNDDQNLVKASFLYQGKDLASGKVGLNLNIVQGKNDQIGFVQDDELTVPYSGIAGFTNCHVDAITFFMANYSISSCKVLGNVNLQTKTNALSFTITPEEDAEYNIMNGAVISFNPDGTLNLISHLPENIVLNSIFSKTPLTFLQNQPVFFNGEGLVNNGTVQAFDFEYQGLPANGPYLTQVNDTQFSVRQAIIKPSINTINGLPVLVSANTDVGQLCTKLGYKYYSPDTLETMAVAVVGSKDFYDLESGTVVSKTDEVIQIVDPSAFTCKIPTQILPIANP